MFKWFKRQPAPRQMSERQILRCMVQCSLHALEKHGLDDMRIEAIRDCTNLLSYLDQHGDPDKIRGGVQDALNDLQA